MTLTRRSMTGALLAAAAMPALRRTARAENLQPPGGKVILTISGKITATNEDGAARFDRGMLEALGWSRFTTTTPWYDGPVTFSGVPMTTLLGVVGAHGETVVATALNDYETKIPVDDFKQFNVLLAMQRNGENMPVRDKGPLFIVYPYDSDPSLKAQKYYSRSAWQLARLVVV